MALIAKEELFSVLLLLRDLPLWFRWVNLVKPSYLQFSFRSYWIEAWMSNIGIMPVCVFPFLIPPHFASKHRLGSSPLCFLWRALCDCQTSRKCRVQIVQHFFNCSWCVATIFCSLWENQLFKSCSSCSSIILVHCSLFVLTVHSSLSERNSTWLTVTERLLSTSHAPKVWYNNANNIKV